MRAYPLETMTYSVFAEQRITNLPMHPFQEKNYETEFSKKISRNIFLRNTKMRGTVWNRHFSLVPSVEDFLAFLTSLCQKWCSKNLLQFFGERTAEKLKDAKTKIIMFHVQIWVKKRLLSPSKGSYLLSLTPSISGQSEILFRLLCL